MGIWTGEARLKHYSDFANRKPGSSSLNVPVWGHFTNHALNFHAQLVLPHTSVADFHLLVSSLVTITYLYTEFSLDFVAFFIKWNSPNKNLN